MVASVASPLNATQFSGDKLIRAISFVIVKSVKKIAHRSVKIFHPVSVIANNPLNNGFNSGFPNASPTKSERANIPLYNVSLMIIKNGLSKITVRSPKLMTLNPTMSGNHASSRRSIKPARSAIAVNITNTNTAVRKGNSSEANKNATIGPNSILRFRSSFLYMTESIALKLLDRGMYNVYSVCISATYSLITYIKICLQQLQQY